MALKLVTVREMREIDRVTIQERGTPGIELMERAGRAVAEEVRRHYAPSCVGIVVGKGNNAGDGLVVARLLAEDAIRVKVQMLTEGHNLRGDARANFERLPDSVEVLSRLSVPKMYQEFQECDVVVDAILGTGISGPAKGTMGEAIALVNALEKPIVAIDVPSGLDADRGLAEGACIRANRTVTIGLPKLGLCVGDGVGFAGDVVVVDIGFPADLTENAALKTHLLGLDDAKDSIPARPRDGHKGTFGTLLVIAGGKGMSGAAYLTTYTALRSGCGLVYAAFPEHVVNVLEAQLPEAVKIPLHAGGGETAVHQNWDELEPFFEKADAIAMGPGIGTEHETARLVDELVCLDMPMVIDADALNCLSEKVMYLTKRRSPTVLTPHPGEMARLVGTSTREVQADRLGVARRLAEEARVVVLLKGAGTVIASPDGRTFVNPTGNSGMAKGGSGDVLTGLIGGLLAQGCGALEAACAGAYMHGMAGDLAREELGERGMTAVDIARHVVTALDACDTPEEPNQIRAFRKGAGE